MFRKKMPEMTPLEVYTVDDDPERQDYIFIADNTDVGNGESLIGLHVKQVDELIEFLREAKAVILSRVD